MFMIPAHTDFLKALLDFGQIWTDRKGILKLPGKVLKVKIRVSLRSQKLTKAPSGVGPTIRRRLKRAGEPQIGPKRPRIVCAIRTGYQ